MSTTLVVRFVLGRYHATPWGRHVNEGQVELPPAPWRLLRSLYAVWKTRLPDLDPATVHALLTRLAAPPVYFVPPYRIGHTRHYYPDSTSRRGTPSVDRTLDAFAAFDREAELGIRWPGDLPAEEHKAFARIAESLPYLGRADSVCEAWVNDTWEPGPMHATCGPLDIGESVETTAEAVTLLAPVIPLDVEALSLRPVDVRAGKLLFPPSTRFVGYAKPPEATARPTRGRPRTGRAVEAVRFTLTMRVRPPETEALHATDRLRRAAVSLLNKHRDHVPGESLLAGRHADGSLMTDHQHAHYLVVPDPERRVGELVVWAPGGLAQEETAAVTSIRRLWGPESAPGPRPLDVRVSGFGAASEVLGDLCAPSRVWRSVTPFVPPRHVKRDWATFLAAEVHRELASRGLPQPVTVTEVDGDWRSFVRYRPSKRFARGASGRSAPPGAFLELAFAEPVRGPLALGYLAHFGLGLFRPADPGVTMT